MPEARIGLRWRLAGALHRLPDVRGRDRLTSLLIGGQPVPPGEHSGCFGPDLHYRVRYDEDGSLSRLFFLQYERPALVPVLEACLRPGDVFFDVGAHIGIYSVWAARLVQASGEVHAFEPIPSTRAHLTRLISQNTLDNVVVVPTALGAEPGSITLWLPPAGSGRASAVMHREGEPVQVDVTTLDRYREDTGCRTPALVKIDVEGYEGQVLQGATQLLALPDAPAIVFECHFDQVTEFARIAALLERQSYRLFGLRPSGLREIQDPRSGPISLNTLALPPERHAQVVERLLKTRFRRNQNT